MKSSASALASGVVLGTIGLAVGIIVNIGRDDV